MARHQVDVWREWGRGHPFSEAQYLAWDLTKTPRVEVRLPSTGAHQPLPGDLHAGRVDDRTRQGHFACLVGGCEVFASAVHSRDGSRRDHFRHKTARPPAGRPGHDPESMYHRTAKNDLADWLAARAGDQLTLLRRDEHRVRTPYGVFEPDVYAELRDGPRIAIEYQHSVGDVSTVQAKVRGYAREGITCWWFFGPLAQTCVRRPSGSGSLAYDLIPTQRTLVDLGAGFWWFDAETQGVGTPLTVGRRRVFAREGELWDGDGTTTAVRRAQKPWRSAAFVLMGSDPLTRCEVDLRTGAFQTPTGRRIEHATALLDQDEARCRAGARAAQLALAPAPVPVPVPDAPEPVVLGGRPAQLADSRTGQGVPEDAGNGSGDDDGVGATPGPLPDGAVGSGPDTVSPRPWWVRWMWWRRRPGPRRGLRTR